MPGVKAPHRRIGVGTGIGIGSNGMGIKGGGTYSDRAAWGFFLSFWFYFVFGTVYCKKRASWVGSVVRLVTRAYIRIAHRFLFGRIYTRATRNRMKRYYYIWHLGNLVIYMHWSSSLDCESLGIRNNYYFLQFPLINHQVAHRVCSSELA